MHGGKPGVEIRLEWNFCPNGAVKVEALHFSYASWPLGAFWYLDSGIA